MKMKLKSLLYILILLFFLGIPEPWATAAPSALVLLSPEETATASPKGQAEGGKASGGSQAPAAKPELSEALRIYREQIGRVMKKPEGPLAPTAQKTRKVEYHGNFYEYLRNEALDALPHEVKQAKGEKSILRRNQFGFNLTGPLRIPKLWQGTGKTFFSLTYEGTREKISRSFLSTVPTMPQRTGDYSDLVDNAGSPVTIYDPLTTRPNPALDPSQPVSWDNLQYLRDPFPENVIPLDHIDPVSRKLMEYYPVPNAKVGPFLRNNFFVNGAETNTPNGLIWKVDHSLGGRHKLALSGRFSNGLDGAAPIFDNPANPGQLLRQVRARSVTIAETFNISPTLINSFSFSASYNALANAEEDETDYGALIGLEGVGVGGFPRMEIWQDYVDIGTPTGAMSRYQNASFAIDDGVTLRYKKHNFKFGLSTLWSQVNCFRPRNQAGRFDFNGALTSLPGINNTGNSFAQFLLGWSNRAEQSILLSPSYFRTSKHRVGFSDEYQLTPFFTLSFGTGLQVDTPRREKYNQQSSLSLSRINPANGKPGALTFAGVQGQGETFSPAQVNWEPYISWVLNPWGDRKTVVRGSYSLWFDSFPLYPTSFGTQGFSATPLLISPNEQLAPAAILASGFPQSFIPPPDLSPEAANGIRGDYFDPLGTLPYVQNWSLQLERDLPWNLVFHATYSGQKGTHLFNGDTVELNPLPISALAYRDRLNDLDFNLSLRPFPQFPGMSAGYAYPVGSSSYHGGDLRVEKKMSHGLNFSTSYYFGKSIDDSLHGYTPQNSTNLRVEKSIAFWDITHQWNITYLYELPFGQGKPLFNEAGWYQGFLGGWSLSGVTVFRTGTPIVLRPQFNNTGRVGEGLRVNVVAGTDPRVQTRSPELWFNPSAFDQPPDFTLGNGPRTHPFLRNPGAQNFDMSMTKRFSIANEWTLELLLEAFNALNHGNWNYPDPIIGSRENPNLNAGKIIGSSGGRILQVGLRLNF